MNDNTDNKIDSYGFWSSYLLTLLPYLLSMFFLLGILFIINLAQGNLSTDTMPTIPELVEQKDLPWTILLGTLLPTIFLSLCYYFATRKKGGFFQYCNIDNPGQLKIAGCILLALLYCVLFDILLLAMGKDPIPSWQRGIMSDLTTFETIPIFLGVVVFAPLWEELVFRGFLFRGWSSAIGIIPTTILTSMIWTMMHKGQYGWLYLIPTFILSILLCLIRWKTRSTTLTITIHTTNNLFAFIMTMLAVS